MKGAASPFHGERCLLAFRLLLLLWPGMLEGDGSPFRGERGWLARPLCLAASAASGTRNVGGGHLATVIGDAGRAHKVVDGGCRPASGCWLAQGAARWFRKLATVPARLFGAG